MACAVADRLLPARELCIHGVTMCGLVPLLAGLDAELEARTLKLLRDFFEPHNKAFYAQVGIDFGWEKEIDDHLAQLEAKGEL